jgi:hypothetical protein
MNNTAQVLKTWTHPDVDKLLFPHFYQSLCNVEPWLTRKPLAVLNSLGPPQFAARIKFPVSLASQLGHILSPNHLALHRLSLFGIQPGKVKQLESSLAQQTGSVQFDINLLNTKSTHHISFQGPFMFTAGPIEFPSLVFLLIPLGGDQHILETCNYSNGLRHIQRLPSLADHLFKACPKIYNFFVQLAFDEDQPIFTQHGCMQKFQDHLLKQTKRFIAKKESPQDPHLAIQGIYGQTFQGPYRQQMFERLCNRAEQIGHALAC